MKKLICCLIIACCFLPQLKATTISANPLTGKKELKEVIANNKTLSELTKMATNINGVPTSAEAQKMARPAGKPSTQEVIIDHCHVFLIDIYFFDQPDGTTAVFIDIWIICLPDEVQYN